MKLRYEGTAGGFRRYALPELRKAAMAGLKPTDPRVQRGLRKAQLRDLADQILRRGGDAV